MKITFKKFDKTYIGNYSEDLSDMKEEIMCATRTQRFPIGNWHKINIMNTCLELYLGKKSWMLTYLLDNVRYEQLKKLVNEKYGFMKDYMDDLALIVRFGVDFKDYNLNKQEGKKHWARQKNSDYHDYMQKKQEEADRITDFYYSIINGELDIKGVQVKLNENDGEGKIGLKVENDAHVKMFLYGFAGCFFSSRYGEFWEYSLYREFKKTGKKEKEEVEKKKKTSGITVTDRRAMTQAYIHFLHGEGLWENFNSLRDALIFLGKLLNLSGFLGDYEAISSYNDSQEAWYKNLNSDVDKAAMKNFTPMNDLKDEVSFYEYSLTRRIPGKVLKKVIDEKYKGAYKWVNSKNFKYYPTLHQLITRKLDLICKNVKIKKD